MDEMKTFRSSVRKIAWKSKNSTRKLLWGLKGGQDDGGKYFEQTADHSDGDCVVSVFYALHGTQQVHNKYTNTHTHALWLNSNAPRALKC